MIFKYGIKLVWSGWSDAETMIGFSSSAHRKWKQTIGPGTRMLIYEVADAGTREPERGGRMAIVAEVEVTGPFTLNNPLAPTAEHANTVPIKFIQHEADVTEVPVQAVRTITGYKEFPHQGESWVRLDEKAYEQLVAAMKKQSV
jgi:hypothetical protein